MLNFETRGPLTIVLAVILTNLSSHADESPVKPPPTQLSVGPTLTTDAGEAVQQSWVAVEELSDEFNGDQIDESKWQLDPVGNGWGWIGRPPGLFLRDNVRAEDGRMKVTVSPLEEPRSINDQEFLYGGAIVRSKAACRVGWFYEAKMRANATAMSSTFWMISRPDRSRGQKQEFDIQECVGETSDLTQPWGRSWDQIFHSNLILTQNAEPKRVQLQRSIVPPTKNHERDYIYAAWWKSSREVQFFLDGQYAYTLEPTVDWDLPAYLQMAIEVYDWNPVPADGGLIRTGTPEQRTTSYDWVRVWKPIP